MPPRARPYNEYGQIIADGGALAAAIRANGMGNISAGAEYLAVTYPFASATVRDAVLRVAEFGMDAGRSLTSVLNGLDIGIPQPTAQPIELLLDEPLSTLGNRTMAELGAAAGVSGGAYTQPIDITALPLIPELFGAEFGPERGILSLDISLPDTEDHIRADILITGAETWEFILTEALKWIIQTIDTDPTRFAGDTLDEALGVGIEVIFGARKW